MRFKVDDIVRISKDSQYYGRDPEYNPKDINGKIVNISSGIKIRVDWDTGGDNGYNEDDLRLVRRE